MPPGLGNRVREVATIKLVRPTAAAAGDVALGARTRKATERSDDA